MEHRARTRRHAHVTCISTPTILLRSHLHSIKPGRPFPVLHSTYESWQRTPQRLRCILRIQLLPNHSWVLLPGKDRCGGEISVLTSLSSIQQRSQSSCPRNETPCCSTVPLHVRSVYQAEVSSMSAQKRFEVKEDTIPRARLQHVEGPKCFSSERKRILERISWGF